MPSLWLDRFRRARRRIVAVGALAAAFGLIASRVEALARPGQPELVR
jgi:hypothetical protein